MTKTENRLLYVFAFLMAAVVALSNYLVQFPIGYFGLENLLTYGAFSYPVAFLITDLSNRKYGKNTAKKIVYFGFALGVFLTLFFIKLNNLRFFEKSVNFSILSKQKKVKKTVP